MKFFIKTLTGRKQTCDLESSNKIFDIKQYLQEKEGINIDQIRLILNGKQLLDDALISTIPENATVHVVLQLRGGK